MPHASGVKKTVKTIKVSSLQSQFNTAVQTLCPSLSHTLCTASSDGITGQTSPTLRSLPSLSPSLSPSPWLCETCAAVRSGSLLPECQPSCCGSALRSETCWTFLLLVQMRVGPRSGLAAGSLGCRSCLALVLLCYSVSAVLGLYAVRFGSA